MGSASWYGSDIAKIGKQHGWEDAGPGGNHPHVMKKAGHRPVPIRHKLQNPQEVKGILQQMEIPKSAWPSNLR